MKQEGKVIHPKSSGIVELELTPASECILFTKTFDYLSGEVTSPGPLDAVTREPILRLLCVILLLLAGPGITSGSSQTAHQDKGCSAEVPA